MKLKTENLYQDTDSPIFWHCDVVGATMEDCGGIRYARTSASSPEEAKKRANHIVDCINSYGQAREGAKCAQ